MLDLEVIPEYGLVSDNVELILGMHFSNAVAIIQHLVGVIKSVEILYSDKTPLEVDLIVNLTNDGIKLIFDPVSQRLKIIQVYDLTLLRLKYGDHLFNCPEVTPTIEQIDQSFGATHPGVYDDERKVFTLTFRGLSFEFPAGTEFQPSYGGIKRELGRLQFPVGESPHVSRMSLYCGNDISKSSVPPPPLPRYPSVNHQGVEILRKGSRTLGMRIRLVATPSSSSAAEEPPSTHSERVPVIREVYFGDSVQDVLSSLGSPAKVFYKSDDKMKIHSPNAHRKVSAQKSDYFYNYFTMGFDILFDAKSNSVKKFVLHTNYPGHYNFNMYHRCQFELPLSKNNYEGESPVVVSSFSRWDNIASQVSPSVRPVVLNRASSTNTTNPFGSTFCYGYQDVIFEVMPNGHLASVTLYCSAAQLIDRKLRQLQIHSII
eukprot:TRINITY_DN2321_c0_g1_i1.p1 TRINITY_DN2321_c0_g1~~TRINITY_DN2321_c0_g1_i1.p1  ORF type:complete len:430 (+),score=118.86 TRINITY_DN2321_c0_g1_i1:69-1358(+)